MPEGIVITGLADTQLALKTFPRLLVARSFVKALKAGLDVLEAELIPRIPSHSATIREAEGGRVAKQLKDAIVSEVILSESLEGGTGAIGFGNLGHVALWVEYGHRMVGHKPAKKVLGDVDPHPFMRPAFEAAAEAAIEAFGDTLSSELNGGI